MHINDFTGELLYNIFASIGCAQSLLCAGGVCSLWRTATAPNALWKKHLESRWNLEEVLFAETYLAGGLGAIPSASGGAKGKSGKLNFKAILAKRLRAKKHGGQVFIIDWGIWTMHCGWSGTDAPEHSRGWRYNERTKHKGYLSRLKGLDTTTKLVITTHPPFNPQTLDGPGQFKAQEAAQQKSVEDLRASLMNPKQEVKAKSACILDQSILAMVAARRTAGVVLHYGFQTSSIGCVDAACMLPGSLVISPALGAVHLLSYLVHKLHRLQILSSGLQALDPLDPWQLEAAAQVLEKYCCVAPTPPENLHEDVPLQDPGHWEST
ncbi:Actin-like protein arp8 [Cymbomonas tetramitiformis]|uniref:Actin-like protein arp8 n=1 Tax=Cymbomonas tetramitiformis TaxID=36881 RepID=A0AAE0CFW0_9CHLO|nr:Actin-like protein arp8 [Cymbomonas tetramitiformis]